MGDSYRLRLTVERQANLQLHIHIIDFGLAAKENGAAIGFSNIVLEFDFLNTITNQISTSRAKKSH
jgi:hypothetical protein